MSKYGFFKERLKELGSHCSYYFSNSFTSFFFQVNQII